MGGGGEEWCEEEDEEVKENHLLFHFGVRRTQHKH